MNGWLALAVAGLFEIVGAHGFQRLAARQYALGGPLTLFGFALALPALHVAAQDLPISIAYGLFTAIGTLGSVITGGWLMGERLGRAELAWILIVIIAIVGLKTSTP